MSVKIYTKEELETKVASTAPADRKEIADVLKHYGKPLSELVTLKNKERIEFILAEQAKAAKGKGKAAAAGAKAAPAAAGKPGKGAAKSAPEPEEEEEEEEKEPEAEAEEEAPTGGGASGEDVAALSEKVDMLTETVNLMAGVLAELMPFIKETHYVSRAIAAGLDSSDDEVKEALYNQLQFPEADGGND